MSNRPQHPATGLVLALVLVLAAPWLAGCATNPATGNRMVSFMSSDEEARIGRREHEKLVPAFGGVVADPALGRYVTSVGQLLARTSELPGLKFTFTVLNTDKVNAFALPGGYVYITRGLLALANSEAEIAGVMAHEIGHVTARHSAQQHSRSIFANIGVAAVGILTGSRGLANMAGSGTGLYLKSYSREHEFEADTLGVRYLRRAGFDPGGMATFLASLRAHSRLSAKLMGLSESKVDEFNIMATHPRTLERVERATREAGGTTPSNPITGRDIYLRKIKGLIYGDTPEQGFVRGRDFLHPVMRIRFQVPRGFTMTNQPNQVVARGPDGAVVIFDGANKPGHRSPYDYLVNVWARKLRLRDRESLTVNGLEAATGRARIQTREGARNIRLVTIKRGHNMYRFLFMGKPGFTAQLERIYRRITWSFRKASVSEADGWKPLRVRIVRTGARDTVKSLSSRMEVKRLREEHFRVINGLGPGKKIDPGQKVKLIVPGDR